MSRMKDMPKTITLGKAGADKELIERIIRFQCVKGLSKPTDALRVLCKDALAIKDAVK